VLIGQATHVQAVVLDKPGQARVLQLPNPQLAHGDVLMQIARAGVCGSDVAVFLGERPATYPLVMRHEAVGDVVDPGNSEHAPHARVVIEPNIPCGRCPFEDAVGIEPLAVGLHAADLGDIREGDHAAVIVREDRLSAAQRLGADRVVLVDPRSGTGDARHALAGLESVPAALQAIAAAEDDGKITIALEGATP
jgi:threonine dehydrogenase-like Zn-dependent dehydrogenase